MPARKIVFTNVSDFDAGGLAVFLGLSVPCIVVRLRCELKKDIGVKLLEKPGVKSV